MASKSLESKNGDFEHFMSIPWCRAHLQGAGVAALIPRSRRAKASTEDELFSRTLNTPETFSAYVLFYEEPRDPHGRVDEVKAFLTLNPGVNGYPGVCHGGIVATILDEVLGVLMPLNQARGAQPPTVHMTAYLHTTYLQPVRTPATVLVTTRINKVDGRKVLVEGSIWDEKSTRLARAEALFVELKKKL